MRNIFSAKDEGRQFIEVALIDNSVTKTVLDAISGIYPNILDYLFEVNEDAFYIEVVDGVQYGFCLNDFRRAINQIAATMVALVAVDLDEIGQLYR